MQILTPEALARFFFLAVSLCALHAGKARRCDGMVEDDALSATKPHEQCGEQCHCTSRGAAGDSRLGAWQGMHTSASVSIRQHTSAYVSIRQHTYAELLVTAVSALGKVC